VKTKSTTARERGAAAFVAAHRQDVTGVLSGWDRVRMQGVLRALYQPTAMENFLLRVGVPFTQFAGYVRGITKRIRAAGANWAQAANRPCLYVQRAAVSKEEMAREIAKRDGITKGPVALLSAVEPCRKWQVRGNRETKHLEFQLVSGKCIHLYFYLIHPQMGLIHLRLQTWFPFLIQVCLNGREWLGRQLQAAGQAFTKCGNCFTQLGDALAAQRLADAQDQTDWPAFLEGLLAECHPVHREVMTPLGLSYYWSAAQTEYATDVMFSGRAPLHRLYPKLIRHGLEHFGSADVLRFLSSREPQVDRFQGEVNSDVKQRAEGVRIKHRRAGNSVKMYDKQGQVLRVETTINQPKEFTVYRAKETEPDGPKSWRILRRGVADLHRRGEVSRAVNARYLEALAATQTAETLGEVLQPLCRPLRHRGRRFRALRPLAAEDGQFLRAINRGEFALSGFRNRDLRTLLFSSPPASRQKQRQQSAAVSRRLALLRRHGLIRKCPGTHRYLLTAKAKRAINGLCTACALPLNELEKLAA
jgi:hypothetical protein